ncbi:MAG TPA: RluA family pseudouridine synthase [Clostridiales bacterium]|jgi:23S rRNA pseudouridine1911/1915/1917 synthase|nr:RluA family pseudouridine synthase [Clostridiales bacterium]
MEYIISASDAGEDIKAFLRRKDISRRICIRLKNTEGGILVNGEFATVRRVLHEGDVLTLSFEDREPAANINYAPPADFESSGVTILYEDERLIAFDKPPFMPTHISCGHLDDSLLNAAAGLFKNRGVPFVFRPVNRLDRDTSGIVLCAKDQPAASIMSKLLIAGRVEKSYIAVLDGAPELPQGIIEGYIRRKAGSIIEREPAEQGEPSQFASTRYKLLGRSFCGGAVVEAMPITGRTHQLRVHFKMIGCPILGDTLYGEGSPLIERQALHASELSFPDPFGENQITIVSEPPPDIRRLYKELT